MPYVTPEERSQLDTTILALVDKIKETTEHPLKDTHTPYAAAGLINYTITMLIRELVGRPNYRDIAVISGILHDVQTEFDRMYVAPYERLKIEQNGPIY